MRDRVGHKRALAQEQEGPRGPGREAEQAGADRDEGGVVARLKQKGVDKRGQARDPDSASWSTWVAASRPP
jgi:hypothetical protein